MRKFFLILFTVLSFELYAQELIVFSVEQCTEPLIATMQQKDLNGNICSLVKVQLPVIGCKFDGSVISTRFEISEYWVYLSPGAKQLNIKCPNKNTCIVNFDKYGIDGLQSKRVYNLKLQGWEIKETVSYDTFNFRSSEESIIQMKKIMDGVDRSSARSIGLFKDGISPIQKDGKYAFVDKDGNQLTAFAFDGCLNPYYMTELDEAGWIVKRSGLYGVINNRGKLSIDCKYKNIERSGKLAACTSNVKVEYGAISAADMTKANYDIINIESGEILYKNLNFSRMRKLLYGDKYLPTFPLLKDNKKFVDEFGKKAFSIRFEDAYPYSENLACIKTKKDGWIIIDQNGYKMGTLPFGTYPYRGNGLDDSDGCFHNGMLAICNGNKKGYVDKEGNIVITPQYDRACQFSDGLALVSIGDSYTGDLKSFYIDKSGHTVINPDGLNECRKFINGVGFGRINGDYILFDKEGNILINGDEHNLLQLYWYGYECFKYNNLYPIKKSRDSGYVYINRDYKISSGEFRYAEPFFDEFTKVISMDGIPGIIDGYGNVVYLTSK